MVDVETVKHTKLIVIILSAFLMQSCFLFEDEEVVPDDYVTGFEPTPISIANTIPAAIPPVSSGSLPGFADLSDKMPEVGNQGYQGSCVGWATGYYLKSYHEKIEEGYSYTDNSRWMSPAFVYNQVKIGDCLSGSYFVDALEVLRQEGVCSWESFPYDEAVCSNQPGISQLNEAFGNRIQSYSKLYREGDNNPISIADLLFYMKTYLSSGVPILIGYRVDNDFQRASPKTNGEFIYKVFSNANVGSHASLVVGYNNDKSAFKVVNSWGVNWGNQGYFWLDYNLVAEVVFEAYTTKDVIDQNTGGSEISLSGNLNFGNVNTGTTETRPMYILNNGSQPFTVSSITPVSGPFSCNWTGTIAGNSSQLVTVRFTPEFQQPYQAVIEVVSNADDGENTISATGIGVDGSVAGNGGNIQITNNAYQARYFHIKKQGELEFDDELQIVVPSGETRFYYQLDPGIYLFESASNENYYTWYTSYDAGQLLVVEGQTTPHNINL